MPNMEMIAEIMFELIQVVDIRLNLTGKKQVIIEELIEHYFSSSMKDYDEKNIKWVLSAINYQNHITSLNCALPIIKMEAKYFKVMVIYFKDMSLF